MKLPYIDNLGNAMTAAWFHNRKQYWRMTRLWHMAHTGSRTAKQYGRGPYPTTLQRGI